MNDVLTGHSPDVEVFTDGLLQVVVHWTFLESHVEISPQVFIQHLTCWQKKMTKNLKGFVFFMVCKTAPLTMTEVTNWKFICGDACVCVGCPTIVCIQLMACEVVLENYLYSTDGLWSYTWELFIQYNSIQWLISHACVYKYVHILSLFNSCHTSQSRFHWFQYTSLPTARLFFIHGLITNG